MDGRQRIDVDRDGAPGLFDEELVGVGQQHDRLLGVVDDAVGQAGLVVHDEDDAIGRRHVTRGDDREFVPRNAVAKMDVADAATRHRTSDGDTVQHARERHVVDVLRLTGDFGAAFFPRDGLTDEA